MTALLFPFIEDIDRSVRQKILQPRGRSGQPRWDEREFEEAYNKAHGDLFREINIADRNYQTEILDVSVPAGTTSYQLPARTSFLRGAILLDEWGRQREWIGRAQAEDLATEPLIRQAFYRPDKNSLEFTKAPDRALSVKLVYGAFYVPLLHGAFVVCGLDTGQLADWSSVEDGLYIGLVIRLVEGPGNGTQRTVTAYDGATQTITVDSPWPVAPNFPGDTTRYTSRPDLPWWCKDVFENYALAALYEKTDEGRANKYIALGLAKLRRALAAIKEQDRRESDIIRDKNLEGGFGDPADSYGLYY